MNIYIYICIYNMILEWSCTLRAYAGISWYTSADTLQHNMFFLDLRAPVKSQRRMLESTCTNARRFQKQLGQSDPMLRF